MHKKYPQKPHFTNIYKAKQLAIIVLVWYNN